ncbi:MAG TPA: PQQ-dependent sugar dehydrogenase [Steroidobacteraceae bacterium]|nr:PQQ-dependent sugar dehydrogenase [Steroidobacteraceae bacterium]
MNSETRARRLLAVAGLAVCLGGCGGGGSGSPPPTIGAVTLGVMRVYPGLSFDAPVGALQAPGDSSRWFVIEQAGRVRVFANQANTSVATEFVDLRARVASGGETGLLGMAFHPRFPVDPRVYVSYTAVENAQLVSRLAQFQSRDGGLTLDPASEVILLRVNQPESNHNGGQVLFGPDGFLYMGLGDGGGAGDAHGSIGNGQDPNTLLGKLLRIDVDSGGTPYAIPTGNPNAGNALCSAGGAGAAACAEIYAWGLRNPWRFSFDRSGGALWIGDVGQNTWEEVDRISAPANLGWRCREGAHPFNSSCGPGTGLTEPVAEYAHNPDDSITGGFVYRGNEFPELLGQYVCGDFVSGRLFHFDAATATGSTLELSSGDASGLAPSAFAQDLGGELYVVDYNGGLYQLVIMPTA